MTSKANLNIHGVRDNFILAEFLEVRTQTLKAIDLAASQLQVGMNEKEGIEAIDKILKDLGVAKKWHPTKFRIGENTLCSFSEKSPTNSVLKNGEIFFLDIGPVWGHYEGDMGRTYIFGDYDQSHPYITLKESAQKIFETTTNTWKERKLSGVELYDFAVMSAKELGLELNTAMKGHRLGDFPHHLFYRGGMNESSEVPCDNLWVLEILIADPSLKRGAFFEDILCIDKII